MDASAQKPVANYDEALVGSYTLPDPLRHLDGSVVSSREDWMRSRRSEIFRLYQDHVYGRTPSEWGTLQSKVIQVREDALHGTAIRKLVKLTIKEHPEWAGVDVLLYLPKKHSGPVPCFLGLNFKGNHSVTEETDVPISAQWLRDAETQRAKGGEFPNPESTRGIQYSRWVPDQIIAAGYGLATAYYGDMEADHAEGWKHGIRAALSPGGAETQWKENDWGGIGAWAWGLSRMLDFLNETPEVDAKRCAVIGHSRLGKTALWAGASDERFSIVISNNSGEGGAALMRRNYGETVAIITKSFPHWFAGRFSSYAGNEGACPVDQHMLISLMAPRPVAVGSAVDDRWADPKGEFLSAFAAGPVYALFEKQGVQVAEQPAVGESVGDTLHYHVRAGGHDVTPEDWQMYLNFCRRHWGR